MLFVIIPLTVVVVTLLALYLTSPYWYKIGSKVVDHTQSDNEEGQQDEQQEQ